MKKRLLVLPLAAMLLAGCGETPSPQPKPDEPTPGPVVPTKTLTGIEVATQPTKVNYKEGETFNPAGMVVNAVYDDGSKEAVTNYQVSDQALVAGATSIEISYEGKKATVAITVTPLPTYVVTFMASASEKIKDVTYKEGQIPSCSYSVPATAEYTYKMEGWSLTPNGVVLSELPEVTANATYYAIVSKTKNRYMVTFETDTSEHSQVIDDYGTVFDDFDDFIPENEGFKFAGWYLDANFENKVSFPYTLKENATVYAKWTVDFVKYLKVLLGVKDYNPYSYIPETMKPSYESNFVQASDVLNYETTQSVSNIKTKGFGEQWEMVIDNIEQSERFYKVLSGADNIFTNAIGALVTHFTNNPGEESGTKTTENYVASCSLNKGVMSVGIEFKKDISIPLVGSLKPVVEMSYAIKTGEKIISISLNDDNKLRCKFSEDEYIFGISYGLEIAGKTGIRTAYCQLNKDDQDRFEGSIYEYFSYMGEEKTINLVKSFAKYYADLTYCSVIGNKASGLIGTDAMINELYDIKTGHLYGYMVEEDISLVTYNTFWFNLEDINNLISIKCVPNSKVDPTDNHSDVYVNGSEDIFEPAYNKVLLKKTSRKYDIEMRDHYYYGLNDQNELVKYDTQIPMIFIQDDDANYPEKTSKNHNYSDFSDDMDDSGVANAFVKLDKKIVNKIRTDCIELGKEYKEDKDVVTPEAIIAWLNGEE